MRLKKNANIVLLGDNTFVSTSLTRSLTKSLQNYNIHNSAQKHYLMEDVLNNFQSDCTTLKPSVVFVSIGNEDSLSLRRDILSGTTASMLNFENQYHELSRKLDAMTLKRVVLIEPFYVSRYAICDHVRYDIQDKIYITRKMAKSYGFELITLDGLLNQAAFDTGAYNIVKPNGLQLKKQGIRVLETAILDKFKVWIIL